MRTRSTLLALASPLLASCVGGAPSAPPGLTYGLPTTTAVTYVVGDTAGLDIDAGGQPMQASVSSAITVDAAFARAPEGLRVALTVRDLDARVRSPLASVEGDESGIEGALVLWMDRRGVATVVSQPTLSGAAEEFFQALSVAHKLFPRLPGKAVGAGESWTDTIRIDGAQGPGSITAATVVTSRVVGDTVVGGRSLLKVATNGSSEATTQGVTAGMDFSQTVRGPVTGWFLWDLQRGLLVESYMESDARGSMTVAAAPFPLGIRLRSQSRVRLADGS